MINWYKKAALNPWSIFDYIPDENSPYIGINRKRLESFVHDTTDGVFKMFIKTVASFQNNASFYITMDGHTTFNNEECIDKARPIVDALKSTGLFEDVIGEPKNLYGDADTAIAIRLTADPEHRFKS
jgi:hypothetical protein